MLLRLLYQILDAAQRKAKNSLICMPVNLDVTMNEQCNQLGQQDMCTWVGWNLCHYPKNFEANIFLSHTFMWIFRLQYTCTPYNKIKEEQECKEKNQKYILRPLLKKIVLVLQHSYTCVNLLLFSSYANVFQKSAFSPGSTFP